MSQLEPTYGNFTARGVVVGLMNDRAFSEGGKEGGNAWKKVTFGIKINHNAFDYVELMGSKSSNVKLIYRDPISRKMDKNKSLNVSWSDRYTRRDNYEIHMPIKANLRNDNDDVFLTSYDAVDYIRDNMNEGDSVFINGSLQITEYKEQPQEKFLIREIYLNPEVIDFNSNGYKQESFFSQEIVFLDINNDKANKICNINSNIIYRKDGSIAYTPYTFKINYGKYKNNKIEFEKCKELIMYFKENLTYGSLVKIHGNMSTYVELTFDKNEPMVKSSTIKELEITGGNFDSVNISKYTEEDFAKLDISNDLFSSSDTSEVDFDEELFF